MMFQETLVVGVLLGLPLTGLARAQDAAAGVCVQERALASLQEVEEPAFLGVYLDDNAAATNGVTITGVVEGSAAEKAGLKEGDRIVALGAHELATADDLHAALGKLVAGNKVSITYIRGAERHQSRTTLGTRPDLVEEMIEVEVPEEGILDLIELVEEVEEEEPLEMPLRAMGRLVDTRVEVAPSAEGGYLGVSIGDHDKGVAILSVMEGSPAAKAGLEDGDVVWAINDHKINHVEQLVEVVSGMSPGTGVVIQFTRGDESMRKRVRLGAREESDRGMDAVGGAGRLIEIQEEPPEEPMEPRFLRRGGGSQRLPGDTARAAPPSNQEVERLRRAVEELKAENMRLREALTQTRRDRADPPPRDSQADMGRQLRELGAQVRELGQAVRRQGQALEELSRRVDRDGERPEARRLRTVVPLPNPPKPGSPIPPGATYKVLQGDGGHTITVVGTGEVSPKVEAKDGVIRVQIGDEMHEIKLDGKSGAQVIEFKTDGVKSGAVQKK